MSLSDLGYFFAGVFGTGPKPAGKLMRIFLMLCLMVLAVTVPVACGFKLRGAVDIPPELSPVFVEARVPSRVQGAVLQRLEVSQVRVAASQQEAGAVVRILSESRWNRVAAVDRNSKVLARELFLSVSYEAVDSAGKLLVNAQSLDLSRIVEDPDVQVLGKQLEASLIYDDLVQDAADRILGQLRTMLLR
jgi:LPS-assembly lipoprotein